MLRLLVAAKDSEAREQMVSLLVDAGYDVTVTDSAVKAMHNVLKENVHILLLGAELNECNSAEFVSLLKQSNHNPIIILVADDAPLSLIRKVREDGIFYHALMPEEPEGKEEIRQVVKCAIASLARIPDEGVAHAH